MGEKSTGIPTEELERKIEQSNSEVLQLRQEMQQTADNIATRVDIIQQDIKKQNACIFLIQKEFQTSMSAMSNQFTELRNLVQSILPSPSASTRMTMHGEGLTS
jgi:uncharacterized protein (DUF111 family)